jgi:hypothetical protein
MDRRQTIRWVQFKPNDYLLFFGLALLLFAMLSGYAALSPSALASYASFFCAKADPQCLSSRIFENALLISWSISWAWLGLSIVQAHRFWGRWIF